MQTINSIMFPIIYILFLNIILFKNEKIEYNFTLKNYKNNIIHIDIYARLHIYKNIVYIGHNICIFFILYLSRHFI